MNRREFLKAPFSRFRNTQLRQTVSIDSRPIDMSISRRTAVVATIAATGLVACNEIFPTQTGLLKDEGEKAQAIRAQIRVFEQEHANDITKENLTHLFGLVTQLYEATFNKKAAPTRLLVVTPEDVLRNPGLLQADYPEGFAGAIMSNSDKNTSKEFPYTKPVILGTGMLEKTDPGINRMSVYRALMIHELIHTQTKPRQEREEVVIGSKAITTGGATGFKWFNSGGNRREVAQFFDEVNTQLLADFMNDPTGQDTIYEQMRNSPVYRNSLAPNYTPGVKLMKELYRKLCISVYDVEGHHFNAQPGEILKVIDNVIASRGIVLPQSASSLLIDWNPKDSFSEETFAPIQDLVAKIY